MRVETGLSPEESVLVDRNVQFFILKRIFGLRVNFLIIYCHNLQCQLEVPQSILFLKTRRAPAAVPGFWKSLSCRMHVCACACMHACVHACMHMSSRPYITSGVF